ncbi:hypothetical protein AAFC00_000888 [Neodothiora populina]
MANPSLPPKRTLEMPKRHISMSTTALDWLQFRVTARDRDRGTVARNSSDTRKNNPDQDNMIRSDNKGVSSAGNGLTKTGRAKRALKGQRVHNCSICGKVYTRNEHRKRHELTHQARRYTCEVAGCNKPFHRSDLLKRHQTSHSAASLTRSSSTPNLHTGQGAQDEQPPARLRSLPQEVQGSMTVVDVHHRHPSGRHAQDLSLTSRASSNASVAWPQRQQSTLFYDPGSYPMGYDQSYAMSGTSHLALQAFANIQHSQHSTQLGEYTNERCVPTFLTTETYSVPTTLSSAHDIPAPYADFQSHPSMARYGSDVERAYGTSSYMSMPMSQAGISQPYYVPITQCEAHNMGDAQQQGRAPYRSYEDDYGNVDEDDEDGDDDDYDEDDMQGMEDYSDDIDDDAS